MIHRKMHSWCIEDIHHTHLMVLHSFQIYFRTRRILSKKTTLIYFPAEFYKIVTSIYNHDLMYCNISLNFIIVVQHYKFQAFVKYFYPKE